MKNNIVKKSFALLLLCTSFFSPSHAACTGSSVANSSPKTRPQVLWYAEGNPKVDPQVGETTIALAFWAQQKMISYM